MVKYSVLRGIVLTIAMSMSIAFTACTDEKNGKTPVESGNAAITVDMVEKAPIAKDFTVKTFAFTPKVNDVSSYKVTQINSIKRDNLSLMQTIVQSYTKTIRAIKPDGTVEIAIKIDSMIVNEEGPDPSKVGNTITLKYNSNDSISRKKPEFVQYNSIIGAEVLATVSKFGRVEEVLGLNSIVNQMLGAKKDSVPEKMKEQLMQQVKTQFFQLPIQQEYQTYPDEGNINASKTWTKVDVIPMSGLLTVTNTVNYTMSPVKEVNGRKLAIVRASLTADAKSPDQMPKGIEFTLTSSKFEGTGLSIVDVETGATISKQNNVLTILKAKVKDSNSGQSQNIDQEITTKVSVELLR